MTNDPMTMEEFVEAAPGFVAAGAEWLDANQPGWEGRIDLSVLDLRDACRCVLGQVHPTQDYFEAVMFCDLGPPYRYGFVVPTLAHHAAVDYTPLFALLDELWIALVKERHDAGTLSGG